MADLGKKYTGLSENEALRDMMMTERYLLGRYRSALENGGSARVRACLVSCFGKAAGDLGAVDGETERRECPAVYVREEEEQKAASKYKRYVKEIENSTDMDE